MSAPLLALVNRTVRRLARSQVTQQLLGWRDGGSTAAGTSASSSVRTGISGVTRQAGALVVSGLALDTVYGDLAEAINTTICEDTVSGKQGGAFEPGAGTVLNQDTTNISTAPGSGSGNPSRPRRDELPRSIQFFVEADVDVPSELLLRELDWHSLLNGPLMTDPQYANVRQQIIDTKQRLDLCVSRQFKLSADYTTEVIRRFWSWLSLHATASILDVSGDARATINQALEDSGTSLEALQQRHDAIVEAIQQENWRRAEKMASRAIMACDRVAHLLRVLRTRIVKVQELGHDRFLKCLAVAGGSLVIGIAAEYVAYSSEVPDQLVLALRDACLAGTVVALCGAGVQWLQSQEADEFLQRLETAELNRWRMQNRLEEMVDRIVFEGHDVTQSAE